MGLYGKSIMIMKALGHFFNYEFCIKLKCNSDCARKHLSSKQQGSNYWKFFSTRVGNIFNG